MAQASVGISQTDRASAAATPRLRTIRCFHWYQSARPLHPLVRLRRSPSGSLEDHRAVPLKPHRVSRTRALDESPKAWFDFSLSENAYHRGGVPPGVLYAGPGGRRDVNQRARHGDHPASSEGHGDLPSMEEQGLFVPLVPVQRDGGPGRHLLRGDEELLRACKARSNLEQHGPAVLKRWHPLPIRGPEDDTTVCTVRRYLTEHRHTASGDQCEE